jgi:hypothetical protein
VHDFPLTLSLRESVWRIPQSWRVCDSLYVNGGLKRPTAPERQAERTFK